MSSLHALHSVLPTLLAQMGDTSRVGVGRIVGGWNYVAAAYGIAWGGLILYALSLWIRRPRGEVKPPRNP